MSDATRADLIARAAIPVTGAESDYDRLLDTVGDARLVLIGEASHGTHEFYHERARITRRLIGEKGFCAVAAEADWPDAYRVNCFVRGAGDDASAEEALDGFGRFPTWMWRNAEVSRFVTWLRSYNQGLPRAEPRAGFYGLDLYNLSASIEAVVGYLDGVDPEAARRARARYACLEHFSADPQRYGFALYTGAAEPCEDAVVEQLMEIQARAGAAAGGLLADEDLFAAEQNARLAASAEEYYRSMFQGRVSSWNLRDTHMADTLDALLAFLDRKVGRAKVVVWAHNSHLGDARATEMGEAGELNLGQLARERYGRDVLLVGLTTYEGSVTAADDWDRPGERMRVRPGLPGSYEALLHRAAGEGGHSFMLDLRGGAAAKALAGPMLERAIGVVYRPDTERRSHYFHARLPEQFDLLIHLDRTSAVEPLAAPRARSIGDPPETFPTGL